MIMQSPLKQQQVQPNLRKVPLPEGNPNTRKKGKRKAQIPEATRISLPTVKPGKVILGILILGMCGFFYLSHVFATQALLMEVQQLEAEYNKARSIHDDYKLEYDMLIGPSEIYSKAKELGFIDSGPADKVIRVKE